MSILPVQPFPKNSLFAAAKIQIKWLLSSIVLKHPVLSSPLSFPILVRQ